MLVEKYGWVIQKRLFAKANQDSTFSHIRKNSKMFNITSKCFRFFNNKPSVSRVYNKGFFTCYSCSYYSSMIYNTKNRNNNTTERKKENKACLMLM